MRCENLLLNKHVFDMSRTHSSHSWSATLQRNFCDTALEWQTQKFDFEIRGTESK